MFMGGGGEARTSGIGTPAGTGKAEREREREREREGGREGGRDARHIFLAPPHTLLIISHGYRGTPDATGEGRVVTGPRMGYITGGYTGITGDATMMPCGGKTK